jgi:hypothetical protein
MINQFGGDQTRSESQLQGSAAVRPSAVWVKPTVERIAWVKPTVERIALREALNTGNCMTTFDSGNVYS